MPNQETIERFVTRVESGAHAEACAEFYTPDATMQENHQPGRRGRDTLVAHERKVLERVKSVQSLCVRPVFVAGDHVVIRWLFRFEWLDGTRSQLEELACQRWEDELIAEETFFYDPAQMKPRAVVEPGPRATT